MTVLQAQILERCLGTPEPVGAALCAGGLIVLGSRTSAGARGRAILCGVAGLMGGAAVNRMAKHGRGLVSIAVDVETAFRLGLRRMAGAARGRPTKPEYLVSIEAATCSDSGISAHDRAATLRAAGALEACQDDLVSPGHIMPMLVGDCLSSSATLPEIGRAIVARYTPYKVAAWCDVLDDDGELADFEQGARCAERLAIPFFVADGWSTPNASFPSAWPVPDSPPNVT